MNDNLISTGLMLTLYGMGTVCVFLVLLIGATRAMSRIALKLDSAGHYAETRSNGQAAQSTTEAAHQGELVAVIVAAVRAFQRTESRRQHDSNQHL